MDLLIGRSAEQGSRQLLWASLGPDGKDGQHTAYLDGAYVTCGEVREPSDWVMSLEGHAVQERIWVSVFFFCTGLRWLMILKKCVRPRRLIFLRMSRRKWMRS